MRATDFFARAGGIAALLLAASCAQTPAQTAQDDVVSPYQRVSINTPGVTGAACVVATEKGNLRVTSPGSVTVARLPTPITITCRKGAHLEGSQYVHASYVPQEAARILLQNDGEPCRTCSYPAAVTVAMELDLKSLKVTGDLDP